MLRPRSIADSEVKRNRGSGQLGISLDGPRRDDTDGATTTTTEHVEDISILSGGSSDVTAVSQNN